MEMALHKIGFNAMRFLRCGAAALLLGQPLSAEGPAAPQSAASPARVESVSFENGALRVRLDKPSAYKAFALSDPFRVVLELDNTWQGVKPLPRVPAGDVVRGVRASQFETAPRPVARVVVDLKSAVVYEARQSGNEIVLSFNPKAASAAVSRKDVSSPAVSAPAGEKDVVSGQAEATVISGASTADAADAAKALAQRPRDLLASLPKNIVTLDFENADVRDVIRVLSEMSGINMVYTTDISGFVTLHLDQVPFNECFNTILVMQGLVAQQMGNNVLRILTPQVLSDDRAKSVLGYRTFNLNYAKASDVAPHLSAVKISPSAKVTVDDRSNALVLTDTSEGIAAAERLIAELDRRPRQVLIEAKMVEVILTNNLDLGIQWEYSGIDNNRKNKQMIGMREVEQTSAIEAGEVGFPKVGTDLTGTAVNIIESSVGPGGRGTGVNLPGPQTSAITFGFINNTDLLTMTLSALSQKGTTKILSSPKIITVDNRAANIQVGSRIPFTTIQMSPTGTAIQSYTMESVGIKLDVTPTISADDRIRLKVRPEVSFPGAVTPGIGPTINTRNAETEVLIRDGETLVIGGLIDEQTLSSASKVPLLGDLPVLGAFFRSSSDSKRRSELLVFLTPRIIRD